MIPFQINPEQAMKEVQQVGEKLAKGFQTLAELGDIEVGCTPKEAVYHEDKLTLYHFVPFAEVTNKTPF